MHSRIRSSLLFTALLSIAFSSVAGDSENGKALYQTCVMCHGDKGQGNDQLNAPALAGQYDWYLQRQIKQFKTKTRGTAENDVTGMQMQAMANTLSDDAAIADVSAYLAALPSQTTSEEIADSDLKNGDNKYNAICGACHGATAQGNEGLNAPNLAILSSQYLLAQTKKFQQNQRGYDANDKYGKQMKMMAGMVKTEADLKDIVAFIKQQGK
ncbi:c-type cytochrome [Thalassotalea sp. HSM 43]|uniref:c-type cytochrome n=1 Tax=Thalassotalea sp. HSM 43 TaxID=2552945 RepID=UPI0010818271|nr:c-type cytochrome [Thalassotalea sp. HSM 43]QBY05352.1 c-type cytochrome [Thalassotalea sp. HSM 43]